MGYVGRAGILLSFPECFNEGSLQGSGREQGPPLPSRSRPHGKWVYLLSSDNFKEHKDQLVVLQFGKEAIISC